ncbi:MAG: right-handed parallel beta-helix repeat-containing protein [Planctomycetota bacterium]|jgi:predicted outer membrane repeat protein
MERQIPFILLFSAFLLAMVSTTAGEIITVDDDGPADFNNIQAAIDAAANGDTVSVADGTYTGDGNRDIQLTGKSITVRSENGPENCTIDSSGTAAEPHRGFNFSSNNQDVNSTIAGFTIINAYAIEGGAGINCRDNQSNSALTISNCNISNNTVVSDGRGHSGDGGGISILDGIYFINNCNISNNSADQYGGGIYCYSGGRSGHYTNPNINNCTFSGNSAGNNGGGIYCGNSIPNIKNCTINNNSSWRGGGIYFYNSRPDISNCVISSNSASNGGGGIYCLVSYSTISNCTITGNSAGQAGGVYNRNSDSILTNCILWGNSASQIYNESSIPVINYCCIQDWSGAGTGNFGEDPLLAPDGFHLLPGSPCINAGDPSSDYTGQIDIDGQPRVMAGRADIGADEVFYQSGTLTGLEIAGPDHVYQHLSQQYTAVAHYVEGPVWHVTHSSIWSLHPQTFADIDSNGVLTTGLIDTPQDITIYAQYTEDNITLEAQIAVQLLPPRTLYVPTEYDTIQAAIDAANTDETVLVADGTYTGEGNRDLQLTGKSITVRSENGPENCIIDCNGTQTEPHRGFNFSNNQDINSIIYGFTIINGYSHTGAGIDCQENQGSTLNISNCKITGNTIFDGSSRRRGGGINCQENQGSTLNISNCKITGNTIFGGRGAEGGGISITDGIYFINNCEITKNWAGTGGGIYCEGENNATITNCNISKNSAKDYGGGIFCLGSSPTINNCTISNNTAVDQRATGGGMCSLWVCNPTVTNCIFWDNVPEQISVGDGTTTAITYSNIQNGWPGIGNIDADPCFVEAGYWDANGTPGDTSDDFWVDGDYHLLPDSPCINTGDPNYIAGPNETDLDGNPRVFDGRVDMGAYEFVPPIEVRMKLTPQTLNPKSKGRWLKAHLVLPEGFAVEDVDANVPALLEPLGIESEYMNVFVNGDGFVEIEAAFSRTAFCGTLTSNEPVEVTVIGLLTTGQNFYGTDTIRITNNNLEYLAVLSSYWLRTDCDKPHWCDGADLNADSVVNFIDFALLDGCCIEVITE